MTSLIGHNNPPADLPLVDPGKLMAFVERVERLADERDTLSDDISEVYKEVKGAGMDVKTVRKIIQLRRIERQKREMEAEMLAAYLEALGM